MKIVQINAVYGYSSTGRNVSEMHEFFRQQGIESFVFTSDKENINNYVYRIGGKWDHKFHALYSRIWGLQGYFSKGTTREMIRRIKQITPDVVVLHNLHANYIHLPLLLDFLAKKNIATLLVLHDFWFMTGHCCYYTSIGCDKWQTECHHCPLLHTYNKSLFFDRSRRRENEQDDFTCGMGTPKRHPVDLAARPHRLGLHAGRSTGMLHPHRNRNSPTGNIAHRHA